MMTPKKKAEELLTRFTSVTSLDTHNEDVITKTALIAVDEIIKSGFGSRKIQYNYSENSSVVIDPRRYWLEVKEEIERYQITKNWFCTKCEEIVEPINVTYEETHFNCRGKCK